MVLSAMVERDIRYPRTSGEVPMGEETRSILDELVATRRRIIEVLFEIDEIRLQVNPQILAEYAGAVGYLENDLYSWQLKARRLRREATSARPSTAGRPSPTRSWTRPWTSSSRPGRRSSPGAWPTSWRGSSTSPGHASSPVGDGRGQAAAPPAGEAPPPRHPPGAVGRGAAVLRHRAGSLQGRRPPEP